MAIRGRCNTKKARKGDERGKAGTNPKVGGWSSNEGQESKRDLAAEEIRGADVGWGP